jgi:hypothetical protein
VNTATTNASGVATSAVFTAGTVAGTYNVTASVTGATTNATFGLTNTAGPAATITATGGTPQSVPVSTAFAALQATVVDSDQNPVGSGIVVTFTAPGSGASGTFADSGNNVTTATTNASGVATPAVFTANATVGGPYNVVASSGALTPVNFVLTNTVAVPVITATSGSGQSATVNTAFAAPLVATVKTGGVPSPGLLVTFTPPLQAGASGTFAGGVNTATTDVNGVATSAVFTANATAGGPYSVAATVPGAAAGANFMLTNTAVTSGSNTYVFYLSGADTLPAGSGFLNFYGLVGSVTIAANGNVTGGEQDYNNAFGVTSPAGGDTITGGSLTVSSSTGTGTLTLTTNNVNVGVNGTETLNVQFVNSKHALIMQFDGTATSSGSLDLQNLSSAPGGGFAYTFTGVDKNYAPNSFGGVFTMTGLSLAGVTDQNDAGTVSLNQAFNGTLTPADAFGRGSLTIIGSGSTIVYYLVGPEVIRLIDVDTNKSTIGSAYGQGAGSFSNASLTNSVVAVAGNQFVGGVGGVALLGQFSTNTTAATYSGVADESEIAFGLTPVEAAAISGGYSIASDGYGSLTISLGDFNELGIYMTDPALNLNDPNNPSGGGGALVLDISTGGALSGTTGVLVPQTDTATASFTGNYAVGWQDINLLTFANCDLCEFDFIGLTSVGAGNALNGTGTASDPFFTLNQATPTISGIAFSGTPAADGTNPGRYSMTQGTASAFNWFGGVLDVDIYQASGGQLFWMNWDNNTEFLGPLEQQGDLSGLPAVRKPAEKTQAKHKP